DWDWDTGRKRRCHGTPSRNRRRNVASESRFGNTVKLGLWELEVEPPFPAGSRAARTGRHRAPKETRGWSVWRDAGDKKRALDLLTQITTCLHPIFLRDLKGNDSSHLGVGV
ncbi:hypothetical protein QQF64_003027, partial [Cirrhinus molitorella]